MEGINQAPLPGPHKKAQDAYGVEPQPLGHGPARCFVNQDRVGPDFDRQNEGFRLPRIKRLTQPPNLLVTRGACRRTNRSCTTNEATGFERARSSSAWTAGGIRTCPNRSPNRGHN